MIATAGTRPAYNQELHPSPPCEWQGPRTSFAAFPGTVAGGWIKSAGAWTWNGCSYMKCHCHGWYSHLCHNAGHNGRCFYVFPFALCNHLDNRAVASWPRVERCSPCVPCHPWLQPGKQGHEEGKFRWRISLGASGTPSAQNNYSSMRYGQILL